jgi:hypothetical protein
MTCRATMVFPRTLCEEPSQPRPMSIMLSCRSMIVAVSPVLATMTLLALLVGMEGGAAWAQTGGLSHSPAEIVKKYFELDQKGAKLDSMSFEALAPFRSWDTEPIWGKVIVIREFSVAEHHRDWEVVNRLEVVIPVTFEVIGSVYLETAGFFPEPSVEEIRVRVKSIKNRWRIIEPVLPPHVGQKRMINFVKEAWVKETEPAKRESLATLQSELRKAK